MTVTVMPQWWAIVLCLLPLMLPTRVFSDKAGQAMTSTQDSIFNLPFVRDIRKLNPATFLPLPLRFLELEEAYFGIDCVFASFVRPEGTPVPSDIFKDLGNPSRAEAFWENGKPWRAFEYTAFLPGPVPDEIAFGMSKETWTYTLGPSCSDTIPQALREIWFDSAASPDWSYSFGRKGEFMILISAQHDRAMVSFID